MTRIMGGKPSGLPGSGLKGITGTILTGQVGGQVKPVATRVSPLFGAVLSMVFAAGCGQGPTYQAQWRQSAPTSTEDVGIVVKLQQPAEEAKSQLQSLLDAHPQAQVRVINAAQGLYEVFHVTSDEVSNISPSAKRMFKNIYRENLIPRQDHFGTMAVDLSKCKKGALAPSAVIDLTKNKSKLEMGILEASDGEVGFSSVRSKSKNLVSPNIELMWLISGPEGSAVESTSSHQPEISFTPDIPGGYSVILVAQDATSLCGAARFDFGVTYNEPFHGPTAARSFNEGTDAAFFFHLDEIKAREAWNKGATGKGIKIAVLDTGVDYNHPDLAANIYVNPNEIAGNGIDDDGNSFIDDTNGWDFFMSDAFPVDDNRHGTHVAGLAASAVSGVAKDATIIPIKVMGAAGGGDLASIIGGILYAADLEADFINMSLGIDSFAMTPEQRQEVQGYFQQATEYAKAKGTMVVSAAGNGDPWTGAGFDIDKYPTFPASIVDSNMLAVASVDSNGALTPYSNFGGKAVVLAAPGGTQEKPVNATFYLHNTSKYVGLTGTSMATPVVVGALAAVKSAKPEMTSIEAAGYLFRTSRKMGGLTGKVKSGGIIDVAAAVQNAQTAPSMTNLWGLLN